MADRRKRQLAQEELLDARLKYECQSQCPDVLQHYFFHLRQWNRLTSMQLYDAPFYSYPSLMSKQIEVMDGIQTFLLNPTSGPPPVTETPQQQTLCSALRHSNQRLREEINKFLE